MASRQGFLVHVKPLGRLFRGKFRAALQKTALFKQVPAQVWREAWVVHFQAVGNGQAALKYLAPYIFRAAISKQADRQRGGRSGHLSLQAVGQQKEQAEEFIRRFLQHALPRGFVKVRYYGLFAPGQRPRLKQARGLLEAHAPPEPPAAAETETDVPPVEEDTPAMVCPRCGQPMQRHKLGPLWPQAP